MQSPMPFTLPLHSFKDELVNMSSGKMQEPYLIILSWLLSLRKSESLDNSGMDFHPGWFLLLFL